MDNMDNMENRDFQNPDPAIFNEPDYSAIEEDIIEEPIIAESAIEEATIEEPVMEEPATEEPVMEEPATEEPVMEEPVPEHTEHFGAAEPPVYQQPQSQPQYQPQYQYTPPYSHTSAKTARKEPKKAKKKRGSGALTGKIIALALVCALIGSIGGGAIVAAVMNHGRDNNSGIDNTTPPQIQQSTPQQSPEGDKPETPIVESVQTNSGNKTMSPSDVYNNYVSSVVGISNEMSTTNVFGQTSAVASSGSGFIISTDGYIVTNYHVVEGAQRLVVTLHDGSEYTAELVGYEASNDVALLKIDATGLKAVSVGDSDKLVVGDCVVAIGNPLGELTYTMTVGYISAKDREINTDGTPINMLQTDAAINAGNSGGPLFDMNGNVIGITTAKYSGSTTSGTVIEGLGFAIPINDVMKIVPDLQEFGYVTGKAYLGVTVRDLDRNTAEVYGLPLGAYVLSIEEGSCSQTAGLKTGDLITGIDSTQIESYTDLVAALKNYSAGDTAQLSVYRSGQTLTLDITFDEKPRSTETQPEPQPETQPEEEWDPWQGGEFDNPFDFFP